MVLNDTRASYFINPINLFACSLSFSFVGVLYIGVVHSLTFVLCAIVFVALRNLLAVAELKIVSKALNANIASVSNLSFALSTTFGSNKYNAVSAVHTIDSSSRSIFEYFHTLNIVGVDVVERTIALADGHTIDNDIRTSRSID